MHLAISKNIFEEVVVAEIKLDGLRSKQGQRNEDHALKKSAYVSMSILITKTVTLKNRFPLKQIKPSWING